MSHSNRQLALQVIYNSISTTRAELAQYLGSSQATVMRLINELIEAGYIIENDPDNLVRTRGRPSSTFTINPDYGIAIGVEFGRDKLIVSFLSADGVLLSTSEITDVPEFHPLITTLDSVIESVFREAQKIGISRDNIIAFGLAVHDLVSSDGQWITWQHAFDDPFPVQDYLAEKLNLPVKVEDISRAFAFAEHRFGAGQTHADMIYLFVGSQGLGSGIFVNDKLLKSSLGFCGEIGHIIVADNGKLCQCGNYGCLETVATYDAIVSNVQDRLDAGVVSSLSTISDLTFSDICLAYAQGDKQAHIALSQLATDLSKALTSTISILGSTHILIGGDLRNAGKTFLDDLERILRMQLIPGLAHRITVRFAELPNYAGAWGVASSVLDDVWQEVNFSKVVT